MYVFVRILCFSAQLTFYLFLSKHSEFDGTSLNLKITLAFSMFACFLKIDEKTKKIKHFHNKKKR